MFKRKPLRKLGVGYRKSLILTETRGVRSVIFEHASGGFSMEEMTIGEARDVPQALVSSDMPAAPPTHPVYKFLAVSGTQVPISGRWFAIVSPADNEFALGVKGCGQALYGLTAEERQDMSEAINILLGGAE